MKIVLNISLSKCLSSIPMQSPSVTQQGRWLMKNASWLQNTQFFCPPSWIHSAAALKPQSDSFQCRFFHFNSSHSTTRRENNAMYNFQCVSHYMPGCIPQWCLQSSRWHLQLWGRNWALLSSRVSDISLLGVQGWHHMVHGQQKSNLKEYNALTNAEVAHNLQGSREFS